MGVRAHLEQRIDQVEPSLPDGRGKGGAAIGIRRVGVSALFEQRPNDVEDRGSVRLRVAAPYGGAQRHGPVASPPVRVAHHVMSLPAGRCR